MSFIGGRQSSVASFLRLHIEYILLAAVLTISCSAGSTYPLLNTSGSDISMTENGTVLSDQCHLPLIGAVEITDGLHWQKDGFYDALGRRAYFRGVNVAGNAKMPPFMPFEDPRWWDLLASWGFNVVRLTIFWEAIEPEPGIYNRSYLNRVKEMAENASEKGIYVILDMHQDLYSRRLGGDGAPDWAIYGDINNSSGSSGSLWFISYVRSEGVKSSFTEFFQSSFLKEHYGKAWVEVVKSISGCRNILGYDIMNEPSCGDLPNDSGQFENEYLKPFYRQVLTAIREVDPDAVGFVEPHVLDTYGSKLTPFDMDGLVYAPHLYSPISQSVLPIFAGINPDFRGLLAIHKEKAVELGMPLFIGEFGTPWTIHPPEKRDMLVDAALKAMEGEFVDNAYWDYSVSDVDIWNGEDFSLIDERGRPRGLEVNVRPFLCRLKGLPVNQSFDRKNKTYFVSFYSESRDAPAVIHLAETVHYPEGFLADLSDGRSEYCEQSGELIYFPDRDGYHNITIKPNNIR